MSPSGLPERRRIVGTSLKCYFSLAQTAEYTRAIASLCPTASALNIDLFFIPDFISISPCATALAHSGVRLGAQDCFWEDRGAYTGEVSPANLAEAGVKIVEVGHAERRQIFHETDKDVARKAAAIVKNGMVPLVCIGEKTHASGPVSAAVGAAITECKPQIKAVMDAVPDDAEVILAYEPVWAIGAMQPANPDHVVAVVQGLRGLVEGRRGLIRILYGGSAGPGTFKQLKSAVDGLFLGRFAHDINNLERVIQEMGEP
ncbi:hypothetical protein LTR50_006850 [Elasticomyces elasticus]|nr:hypothetical protein LTR50_006850 [Elasticomyces elasticus]